MRPLAREHLDLVRQHYCPNKVHPSDHLPIGAVIRLPSSNGSSNNGSGEAPAVPQQPGECS